MPYLRLTCPALPIERRRTIASVLTREVVRLFTPPRGLTEAEIRERTTVHFVPYQEAELFVGGTAAGERGVADVTVEISDWSMGLRTKRRVARELTPTLAELFHVPPERIDEVNIRFHGYPPTDFSVGGRLLSDLVPAIARLAKRLGG